MSKKLITVLTLGAFLAGGALAPLVANAVEADPWEKAANEFLEKNKNNVDSPNDVARYNAAPKEKTPKPAVKIGAPKVATPKAENPKSPATIDEEYVKQNIDTPTGAEEKAKEDEYLDKAEAKYKEEAKAQDKAKAGVKTGKAVKRLPKTSAVK